MTNKLPLVICMLKPHSLEHCHFFLSSLIYATSHRGSLKHSAIKIYYLHIKEYILYFASFLPFLRPFI